MTQEDKARKMLDAADQLHGEFCREGKTEAAIRLRTGFSELPVGSLARLHDIIKGS